MPLPYTMNSGEMRPAGEKKASIGGGRWREDGGGGAVRRDCLPAECCNGVYKKEGAARCTMDGSTATATSDACKRRSPRLGGYEGLCAYGRRMGRRMCRYAASPLGQYAKGATVHVPRALGTLSSLENTFRATVNTWEGERQRKINNTLSPCGDRCKHSAPIVAHDAQGKRVQCTHEASTAGGAW
jgi:hypothetical protein